MTRTHRPLVVVVAALTLAALTGCGAADPAAAPTADPSRTMQEHTPTSPAPDAGKLPEVPAEAGHIHGIALNPKDDRLYLGTHGGTMVVGDDAVSRVGESTIDLMGFAVAGPDHFYASGHPGPGDDLPDPVGLIESVDGGKTWQSLSLAGQVDFHTLAASGDTVYGFNGQILGTGNGRDWSQGAADVAPAAFAVDPGNSDRLVATTEQGPVRSQDGSASFAVLDGAPLLVFVAWPAPDELWGVDPDGVVYRSTDGGDTWKERGTAAPPAAFTAAADGRVVVVTHGMIVASDDNGKTFNPVATIAGAGH